MSASGLPARSSTAELTAPFFDFSHGSMVAGADDARFGLQDRRPLDDVLQLAHVARPVVPLEQPERLGLHVAERRVVALGDLVQEVPAQLGHVLRPLAQRRQLDRHDVEPVEQVLAELALGDRRLEVAVAGGDDAHVDRLAHAAADALERALLEHAEELGWRAGAISLISSSRACPVGELEAAAAHLVGPGERALLVPKSSDSEQVLAQRGAVDGEHRRSRRSLAAWIARATTSLPVPLSPRISTVALLRPTPLDLLLHLRQRRPRSRRAGAARSAARRGCAAPGFP
jgi:hypothetical protein